VRATASYVKRMLGLTLLDPLPCCSRFNLGSYLKDSIRKGMQQLNNLQLYDMSVSVYQELSKRENKKGTTSPLTYLLFM
jgi:hypothetical protein